MKSTVRAFIVITSLLLLIFIDLSNAQNLHLASPDGRVDIEFTLEDGVPAFSANYRGLRFLNSTEIGIELENQPSLHRNLRFVEADFSNRDETWETVYGIAREVRNHYNEMRVTLEEKASEGRRMNLTFRAFDNGLAFRYEIPDQPGLSSLSITDEMTSFEFASDYTTYGMDRENFGDNYEEFYNKRLLSEITEERLVSMPLLVQLDNGWALLSEAALTNYAGMSLSGSPDHPALLKARLSPLDGDSGELKAQVETPFASPWRTVMLEDQAGDLMASNLVLNLNESNKIADTSFIKPGLILFPWWNGRTAGDLERSGEPSTAVMKYYIDFAAEHEIPYLMVDAGWYSLEREAWVSPEEQNVLEMEETRREYYDIHEVIQYGKEKGVGIHLWVHLGSLKGNAEEVMAAYSDWGVAGIKVDSFGGDDQAHIAHFQNVVKAAAEHKLMLNFHGAYKPTGWSRTYPNLVTREAVMANEHTIWEDNHTPDAAHNVTIPFTRMPVGPLDYTPGAFDLDGTESNPKYMMTTRAQQIAMFVVYYSPLQMVVDYPDAYRQYPEQFRFMIDIPTVWDQTRFISGAPGEQVVVARKKGANWYIGAMTNNEARSISVSLDFLNAGQSYRARIMTDGEDADVNPESVVLREEAVSQEETIELNLQPSGGGAVILEPID